MTPNYKAILLLPVAAAFCASLSFAGDREPRGGRAFRQAQNPAEKTPIAECLNQTKFHDLVTDDAAMEAWLAIGPAQKEIDLNQKPLPEAARKTAKIFKNQFDLIMSIENPGLARMAVRIRLKNARAIEVFNAMNLYFEVQKLPARWILTFNGGRPMAILYRDNLPSSAATVEKISDTVFPIPEILREGNPAVHLSAAEHLEASLTEALDDVRKPCRAKANWPGGPVVKVHTQSGIVVLNGTWEEIELVRSTMQALKDNAQERQDVAKERMLRANNEAARKESE